MPSRRAEDSVFLNDLPRDSSMLRTCRQMSTWINEVVCICLEANNLIRMDS